MNYNHLTALMGKVIDEVENENDLHANQRVEAYANHCECVRKQQARGQYDKATTREKRLQRMRETARRRRERQKAPKYIAR